MLVNDRIHDKIHLSNSLCSKDPNPIPEHDCKRGVYCGSIFIWLFEFIAVIAKTWKFSEMVVVQLLDGHDPVMFCSNLIKRLPVLSEFLELSVSFNAISSRWQRNVLFNMLMSQTIFSIYQQEKERIGINSRASTKILLLKILFRYRFSHLYCLI